jgi:signal transduction histidine kinase
MGLQTLIKKENLNERDKGIMDLIKKSTFGMDEVLREILDYSRNSRMETELTSIDFKSLIDGAFDYSTQHQECVIFDKRITVKETTPFNSDKVRMKIITNNLISNALKYCDKGSSEAFIAINVEVDDEKMTMEVSDNGIGIKTEYLPNIFKMFYRATVSVAGSGLGLYIVKESVEKLGGTILVTSKFGKGTTFKIEIPNSNIPDIDNNQTEITSPTNF